jgi:hypothetical protein
VLPYDKIDAVIKERLLTDEKACYDPKKCNAFLHFIFNSVSKDKVVKKENIVETIKAAKTATEC